ncbi:MAG: FAD-dependent oxidoreductase, partial [Planctomycetales bacterium]|nr:FAD-dependent oxidoreductase [Planctomycetales bacterium]
YIGRNYAYPNASYAERRQIVVDHLNYQRGLMWTLANHPRVPEHVRQEVSRWGMCKDEFESEDGWQRQLYIREARRMVGRTVMTQHHCQGRVTAEQPIGLAAYTMDSHNVQRHVGQDGFVHNEGDVQVGGFSPYPIDYGSILPQEGECTNLLVPVCLSASHMAFGSIRMEPVFMVLGQSAATAAVLTIRSGTTVQNLDYAALRTQLES